MPKATFILNRENHDDHLYGTGAWTIGQTRDVTDEQWDKMKRHADVWALADAAQEPVTSDGAVASGVVVDGSVTDPALAEANAKIAETLKHLDAMTDKEVRDFAASLQIVLPGNIGPAKMRERVREALAV